MDDFLQTLVERVRNRKLATNLTPSQKSAVSRVRAIALQFGDEIKSERISETGGRAIEIRITVGYSDDEGTAATILRRSAQVFVGPRGGVYFYDGAEKVSGWKNVFYSFSA